MAYISYKTEPLATYSDTGLTTASTAMTANLYSQRKGINLFPTFAMQFVWTGTPTGTLLVMGSIDGTNFNIQLATHALTGAAGNYLYDMSSTAGLITTCGWVQGQYTFTSGSGTLTSVLAGTKGLIYPNGA